MRPPQEQVQVRPPVPGGTVREGPDWDEFAARRLAELAAAGDRGALLRAVNEMEHGVGTWRPVSPWRVLEHLAAMLAGGPSPEPPQAEREAAG